MDKRTIDTDQGSYLFASDGVRIQGDLQWGILSARLIDETTGRGIRSELGISTTEPGLIQRVMGDGLVGLASHPNRTFRVPPLDANPHHVDFQVSAQGYLPRNLSVQIDPMADFPDAVDPSILPHHLGNVEMHLRPIIISGRVMNLTPDLTPVSAATVQITAIVRQVVPAAMVPVPDPFIPLSISPGLYFDRDSATHCRMRSMLPSADSIKTLDQSAPAQAIRLKLSNTEGLSPGDVIEVNFDQVGSEFLIIAQVITASLDTSPGEVVLAYPSKNAYSRHSAIRKVIPQIITADNTIGVAAIPGDQCLLMDAVAGYVSGAVLEIDDGLTEPEYQRLDMYSTTTDSQGYFRLPPLNRVGQINLRAEKAAELLDIENHVPDYKNVENTIEFVIKP